MAERQGPIFGNSSNGWDDNYTRDEAETEDEVEDEDEYGDEDEDEGNPELF